MTSPTKSNGLPAKILLVGNNKAGASARKAVLEEQGYLVKTAASADEALGYFSTDSYDLAITAYRLGVNSDDGVQLINKLRSERPDLPVVLISGVAEVLGLNEKNTGADAVIQKSSTEVTHMVRAVDRLLRRKSCVKKPQGDAGSLLRRHTRARGA